MKEILLTQGKVAIVDDDMFEELSKHKWCYGSGGYAVRNSPGVFGKRGTIRMHRVIAKTPDGMDTDHINRDKLDNRRENLRVCSRSENMINTKKQSNNTSGYKGVSWRKDKKKWRAEIKVNGHHYHFGYFDNPMEAAKAYDAAAIKYFGEFANLNLGGVA